MVRGDEAGHDDRAGAVDDLRIGSKVGGDVGADGRDFCPIDQDVRFLEVAHSRVEAEHGAAAQKNAASPAITDEALSVRRRRRAQAGELSRHGGGETGRGLEEVASLESWRRGMCRHRGPFSRDPTS